MSNPWADIRQEIVRNVEPEVVHKELARLLLVDAYMLLAAVPRPVHGYMTNSPEMSDVTLHFGSHEEMLEWLEALAALPEHLK